MSELTNSFPANMYRSKSNNITEENNNLPTNMYSSSSQQLTEENVVLSKDSIEATKTPKTIRIVYGDTTVVVANPKYVEKLEKDLKNMKHKVDKLNDDLSLMVKNYKSMQSDLKNIRNDLNNKIDLY